MSNVPIDITRRSRSASLGESVTYRSIFGVLFVFSLARLCLAKVMGKKADALIWQEAKQGAHASAGYAFKY